VDESPHPFLIFPSLHPFPRFPRMFSSLRVQSLGWEDGGALWIISGSEYVFRQNSFGHNHAMAGGAIYAQMVERSAEGGTERCRRGSEATGYTETRNCGSIGQKAFSDVV